MRTVSEIRILVSGLAWMGSGVGSIEAAIQELLTSVQGEILLTAYSIGQADLIFELIEGALSRGVKVRMVVNSLGEQHYSAQNRLKILQDKYPHFHLYSFEAGEERGNLHAKVIVADRQKALIGSSNLSYSGMVVNHELALLVSGMEAAEVARAIDLLLGSKYCTQVKS